MKSLRLPPRTLTVITLVVVTFGGILFLAFGRQHPPARAHITLAVASQPLSAPVYVAYEKGFFKDEGLAVQLQSYSLGKEALEAVIEGRSQLCTVAETPLVFAGFLGDKVAIIATISESIHHINIIARKDHGVVEPQSLKGKRVGISRGTSGEYFLYAYLILNGIAQESVQRIDIKPDQIATALTQGEIDAAVTWNPYLALQRAQLGDKSVVLSNNYISLLQWNIVASQDFVQHQPDTIKSLLRAFIRANAYIRKQPEEARAIVARAIGDKTVALTDYQFDISLRQNLLINLEIQARWVIASGLTEQHQVPDFLPLLYQKGLLAVNPEAVTIIQ